MTARILVIGDLSVDQIYGRFKSLPEWGQETEYTSSEKRLGGNAGNFAAAAHMLDMPTLCIGPIGADEQGAWISDRLDDLGCDTHGLQYFPNDSSCVSTALVRSDGERLFLTHPGALKHLGSMLASYQFPPSDAALFTGWCQPPRIEFNILSECFNQIRRNGTKIYFDLSWSATSWQQPELIKSVLALTHTAMMNSDEAIALTGCQDVEQAAVKMFSSEQQPDQLVIKCGKDGALIRSRNASPVWIKGTPVSSVGHAVGSGDTFNAAFIHACDVEHQNITQAAEFACAFTSYVMSVGRASQPTLRGFKALHTAT